MIFRYRWRDLRAFAHSNNADFRSRPRGGYYDKLISDGRVGNFRLISEKPLVISHGSNTFTVTRDYLEIFIPDEKVDTFDTANAPLQTIIGFRIAVFAGSFGFTSNTKKTFVIKRRHAWIGGQVTPVNRRERDTDTLSLFPSYIVVTFPHLRRMTIYIFRNPRISRVRAVDRLSEIIGISKSDVRDHINRAITENYVEEITYDYYHSSRYPLLAVLEASKAEGSYSLTGLRSELRKYMSTGEAEFAVYLAIDNGWIVRTKRRIFTTPTGLTALRKLPKAVKRKGLLVTSRGRNLVFGR